MGAGILGSILYFVIVAWWKIVFFYRHGGLDDEAVGSPVPCLPLKVPLPFMAYSKISQKSVVGCAVTGQHSGTVSATEEDKWYSNRIVFRYPMTNRIRKRDYTPVDLQVFHTYTRLLKACLQECKLIQSHRLLDQMPQQKQQSSKNSKVLHAQILKVGLGLNGKLGNVIVDLYSKCGNVDFAQKAFDRLHKRDGLAWNSILSLYSRCGMLEDVILAFGSMLNSCTPPNQFTLAIVLSACAKLQAIGLGRQVHCNIIKIGFELNSFCEGSLIDMYAKSGCINDARKIFDRAAGPDTVYWTAMIAGYVRTGMPEEALKLFKEVQDLGHEPNQVAFGTIMIAYVGLHRLDDACCVFAQMPNPNVVAWNVMISGHTQSGYNVEAINFFHDMRVSGVKSSRSTLGSVLSAIANLAAVDEGQQVHSEAIRLGLDSNVFTAAQYPFFS